MWISDCGFRNPHSAIRNGLRAKPALTARPMSRVKHSELAGTWYAPDAATLRAQLDHLFEAAPALQGHLPRAALAGLIVPHAGYAYSGRAAALGYICLARNAYRRAVILAPSHYVSFPGLAVLDVDFFEHPCGRVAVDRAGVATLAAHPLVRVDPEPFQGEHAIEIQLPLLHRVRPDIQVVPLLVGTLSVDDQAALAPVLSQLRNEETVFIVSSDFVHYGRRFAYLPFPADGLVNVRAGLRALDMGAIERICEGDALGFRQYVAATGATICGRLAIETFLTMHQVRSPGRLLTYYTSLDLTGDYEHSVSYAAIAFPPLDRSPTAD
jgi:hypothetical protein